MDKLIKNKKNINKVISVPGDKSISHRSIMFSSIAKGKSEIEGFLMGEDCISTIDCFRKMGIDIDILKDKVIVYGKGLKGLRKPDTILNVNNSGTTIRLMSGILSAMNFESVITGDESLKKRPMDRICNPLRLMGAEINSLNKDNEKTFAPLIIHGKSLKGIEYSLPVASAQVKSAILLASLYAEGKTIIEEPKKSRNHTEIMLNFMGADIKLSGNKIISNPVKELYGKEIKIPGDISSAAYFMVLASICKNSEITLKNIGVNETRTGIIDVLINMGADIKLYNKRNYNGEDIADITVKESSLNGCLIEGDIIPRLIDEIPVIAVAALFAKGKTVIKNAEELKVKESNRLSAIVTELKKVGAKIEETDDGMIIEGGKELKFSRLNTYNDHRLAMAFSVLGSCMENGLVIDNPECVNISFPNFFEILEKL